MVITTILLLRFFQILTSTIFPLRGSIRWGDLLLTAITKVQLWRSIPTIRLSMFILLQLAMAAVGWLISQRAVAVVAA